MLYEVGPKSNENELKKNLYWTYMQLRFIPFKVGSLRSNTAIPASLLTLYSSEGSLHLRCCSNPLSQLSGRFKLSQNDVLWGGFWAWGIKRNHTEPSHGCMVGELVLWSYFESKISCSLRTPCQLFALNALPFRPCKPCATWRQSSVPISWP